MKNTKNVHQIFGNLLEETSQDSSNRVIDEDHMEYKNPLTHQISIANALFLADSFRIRQDYEHLAKTIYKSEVTRMDFEKNSSAAKTYINEWVDEKTHGKISEILMKSPDPDTEMIVVSALYFKAHWWEEIGVQFTLR